MRLRAEASGLVSSLRGRTGRWLVFLENCLPTRKGRRRKARRSGNQGGARGEVFTFEDLKLCGPDCGFGLLSVSAVPRPRSVKINGFREEGCRGGEGWIRDA